MDQLEKLKEEEAELEALLTQKLGDQGEQPSATDSNGFIVTPEEEEAAQFIEEIVTGTPEELPEQSAPVKRTNWKKRFTGYKASTDATIYEQRQEIENLKVAHVEMLQKLDGLQTIKREEQGEDMFKGAFTDDEVDTFGADGLDVVKKAARVAIDSQVKPLKEQLASQERNRLKTMRTEADNQRKATYNSFLNSLKSIVPNYVELNKYPQFLEWMQQPDEYSGLPKFSLFRKAEASRDVVRVADFFLEYKKLTTNPIIPPSMEKYITPLGSKGNTVVPKQTDQTMLRQSDIDKFYNDLMKGRFAGKNDQVNATEASIERASMEGRILYGQ